jgi:ketosteroid isomerase-like protein
MKEVTMKFKYIMSIALVFCIIGCLACGNDDDDSPSAAKATTQGTQTPPPAAEPEPQEVIEVNFAAEEAAIRAELAAYDADVNVARRESDPELVMKHWIDVPGVVFAHNMFGAVQISKGFQKIRTTWAGIFKRQVHRPHKIIIDEIGIDASGQKATASGQLQFLNNPMEIAVALQKDEEGAWKIWQGDYGKQGIVKRIKTPKQE